MSNSKIQKTLDAEAVQATMQERRSNHAAWIRREARRKNGGLAHAVRLEIRSENKHAVKSAEEVSTMEPLPPTLAKTLWEKVFTPKTSLPWLEAK